MHQSPDDIFAAHFWAWPDPALKRDAHGRVLFVNAAFLQLFGGGVEDWRGQLVQGWHAPQPGIGPTRFEIRTPATPTQPEQVYDWIENCGADGAAFALARNVTVFAAAPPPDTPAEQPPASRQPVDAAPIAEEVLTPPAEPDLPPAPANAPDLTPVAEVPTPVVAETVAETLPAFDDALPDLSVPELEVPDITPEPRSDALPVADVPERAAPDLAPPLEAPSAAPASPAAPAAQADEPAAEASDRAPDRAYERRALPIENDEAVLGNNWRDAVIAKAVGATDGSEEDDTAPAAAPAAAAAPAMGGSGPIRILLAEDNAINALLTRTLLEAEGHTVETVEDGQLAVDAMRTSNFDMILMDMRMPNMDGLESTRKIRALPNVPKGLPIVALTANAFDDDRNACFDAGMNDFMTKPVSAEELSEMVERWTGETATALAS